MDVNSHLYARAHAKEDFEAIMRRFLLTHEQLSHPDTLRSLKIHDDLLGPKDTRVCHILVGEQ
eukprot:6535008-Pyramimonas_sp.AAC.1